MKGERPFDYLTNRRYTVTGYQALLAEKLKETEGRSMYTGTEVRDILLDLMLADKKDSGENEQILDPVPA